jgi:hypothetical protein
MGETVVKELDGGGAGDGIDRRRHRPGVVAMRGCDWLTQTRLRLAGETSPSTVAALDAVERIMLDRVHRDEGKQYIISCGWIDFARTRA